MSDLSPGDEFRIFYGPRGNSDMILNQVAIIYYYQGFPQVFGIVFSILMVHCTGCILSKMARREFFILVIFSDTYTCSYVMLKV